MESWACDGKIQEERRCLRPRGTCGKRVGGGVGIQREPLESRECSATMFEQSCTADGNAQDKRCPGVHLQKQEVRQKKNFQSQRQLVCGDNQIKLK